MKRFLRALIISAIALAAAGCGGSSPSGASVTLQLAGFPRDLPAYTVVVQVTDANSQLLQQFQYDGYGGISELKANISLSDPANAKYLGCFLLDSPTATDPPYYCWTFTYDASVSAYATIYWLNYIDALNGFTTFGISEYCAQGITLNADTALDFSARPYYLFRVSGAGGQDYAFYFKNIVGSIRGWYADSVAGLKLHANWYRSSSSPNPIQIYNYLGESLYSCFEPTDYAVPSSAALNLSPLSVLSLSGKIVGITESNQSNLIYMADNANSRLISVNIVNRDIIASVDLPHKPAAMDFSSLDNKLYILSTIGTLMVYDIASNQLSESDYSTIATGGYDIVVAPQTRRIYMSFTSGNSLLVVDMDDFSMIMGPISLIGEAIEVDETRSRLYVGQIGTLEPRIAIYAILADSVSLLQSFEADGAGRQMSLSPDGSQISFGGRAVVYDAGDLTHVLYDSPEGSTFSVFSHDSRFLYSVQDCPGEDELSGAGWHIHVLDTSDYSEVADFAVPFGREARLVTNADDSVLACFSYDSYKRREYAVRFFGTDSWRTMAMKPLPLGQRIGPDLLAGIVKYVAGNLAR